ncbi:hypothetical protein LMG28688_01095 [Paraburkholderia caffeinitolerans]|uniref:Uncharacterized protein n=1 Tax=Paraburkholderia caffeinitolerans TaxID=1723730 RepID=A0A6J5FIT8_9BURK|nr:MULTISPECIES: hypothetical protein [Paraburkholderia]CAB3780695.1 hypothetical protein LMG28688_01095 [Paraburkholderia caffeinitolerans]
MNVSNTSSYIRLSKKIWAGVPGSDANGYSDPADTIQYAFGVVAAGTRFADIVLADGSVDTSRLIGGALLVTGANAVELALAPGRYWIHEFRIARSVNGSLCYVQRTGWDFTALVNGARLAPTDEQDGAVAFEISEIAAVVDIVAINKSVCVKIDKRFSSSAGSARKEGILFFGTSSYLGLTQPPPGWDGTAIVRLGLTDANGELRLDGFVSGNNVFIHEVVPKAYYDAGVRPEKMDVYNIDGSFWYSAGFPDAHEVTQEELEALLHNPKFTPAARELIRANVQAGDWLFTNQNYFYQRQGVMRVEVTNNDGKKGKLRLSKKIWAGVPGSDANGYSDPDGTIQYAFGVVPEGTHYASIANPDGSVDASKLIGGVLMVVGANEVELALAPGKYWLYEFVIGRDADGVSLQFSQRTGWDFTAVVNGERRSPVDDQDGAIAFEIGTGVADVGIVGINKSLSVEIDKRMSSGTGRTEGVLFFGTSSYLGLTQTGSPNFDGNAVVRLGVTGADGKLRLDGFVSGNNVFIHEVVPKAYYDAGVRPEKMDVYNIDGAFWYSAGFPDAHEVTQEELEALLHNPKFTPAARELIRANVHAGDWLFTNQNYFYQRQGVMRVEVTNNDGKKGKLRLSKKIWAGVPGSDANGYSIPDETIQYAFGVVPAGTHYSDLADADGAVDVSKLIGGVLMVVGASTVELQLTPGAYWLYEFVIARANDGVSLRFLQRTGWDFTALVDGERRAPIDDADGAIAFEIGAQTSVVNVVGINKSLSVQIEKQFTPGAQEREKVGILFLATDSYLGILPRADNGNSRGIVRLGVTGQGGQLRLDGFTSGNNVFIHEVIPQDAYNGGIFPLSMSVYQLDGTLWFTSPFEVQRVMRPTDVWHDTDSQRRLTQADVDALLADPKLTEAGRDLIRSKVRAGDYLFSSTRYFSQRQGVMRVTVLNSSGRGV